VKPESAEGGETEASCLPRFRALGNIRENFASISHITNMNNTKLCKAVPGLGSQRAL